jgi:sulfate transporter 4
MMDSGRAMSVHRRNLNRIQEDYHEARQHKVPEERHQSERKSWQTRALHSYQSTLANSTWQDWLTTFLPCCKWLRTYEWRKDLLKDAIAGLTVGVMIIPQSMSYAKLAGLPVVYGLYSALVPVYAYSLFGSSRQLAVGPVALISLICATQWTHLMEKRGIALDDPTYREIYIQLAIQTAFLVGVTYILMGILRLGFVTVFLSHTVVSGFTTGAAVIIGMSQVKYIFGYDVARSDRLHELIKSIIEGISEFNYRTFLMGTFSILALAGLKHIGRTYPKYKWVRAIGPLTVTAISIIVTFAFDLDNKGIPIVGTIPRGLPSLSVDAWAPVEDLGQMIPPVISIAVVGFMESIAIAKQLASKHKYELDSSLELIGLGMANFLGAMFSSYPVTGSFSRSAVNNESGAKSGISGMVTATLVALVLLFLTPVFEQMVSFIFVG